MLSKSFDQWGSIVRVIPRRQMLSSNYTPWLVTVTIGQLITQILAEARDRGDWVPGASFHLMTCLTVRHLEPSDSQGNWRPCPPRILKLAQCELRDVKTRIYACLGSPYAAYNSVADVVYNRLTDVMFQAPRHVERKWRTGPSKFILA